MTTLKFKTNINCSRCVRTVTGFIEEVEGINSWKVDTDNPNKILTVSSATATAEAIIEAIEDAGFDIEVVA